MSPTCCHPASHARSGHLTGVEVALETGTPLGLIAAVRDGSIDAAVVALPAPAKGLRVTPLEMPPLVAALPAPEARDFEAGVTLERLDPDRLIVLERAANPALHDAVVSLCRTAGIAPALIEAAEPRVEAVLLPSPRAGAPRCSARFGRRALRRPRRAARSAARRRAGAAVGDRDPP